MIVMAKPMQFTIVNAVPLVSSGAFWATNVENKGESAITTNPQTNKKRINKVGEELDKNNGDIRQQVHDRNNDQVATFFAPKYPESCPPIMHDNAPEAIIKKDVKETFKFIVGF